MRCHHRIQESFSRQNFIVNESERKQAVSLVVSDAVVIQLSNLFTNCCFEHKVGLSSSFTAPVSLYSLGSCLL